MILPFVNLFEAGCSNKSESPSIQPQCHKQISYSHHIDIFFEHEFAGLTGLVDLVPVGGLRIHCEANSLAN